MSFHPLFKTKAIEAARLETRTQGHHLTPIYDNEGDPRRLLCHCTKCGMRVVIDSARRQLSGEALSRRCDDNGLRRIESQAWLIGEIPSLLLSRFQEELANFSDQERAFFEEGDFQPDCLVLVSRDGIFALCYEVRYDINRPISDNNRQSAKGITYIERRVPEDEMRWVRYTGPRLNPNGHENAERWLVIPLEHGEVGWTYEDGDGKPRFRREKGTVGYYVERRYCQPEEKTTSTPQTVPLPPSRFKSMLELQSPPESKSQNEVLFQGADLPPQMPAYP